MTNYASILSYMGVDASQDLDNQQYTEEMTYKDYFDQLTVDQLKQTKAETKELYDNYRSGDSELHNELVIGLDWQSLLEKIKRQLKSHILGGLIIQNRKIIAFILERMAL